MSSKALSSLLSAPQRGYIGAGVILQRLFSTFADGWPGVGLVVLRLTSAGFLGHLAARELMDAASLNHAIVSYPLGTLTFLLIFGLWTPFASAAAVVVDIWVCYSCPEEAWSAGVAAGAALALSLLGPGAWSIDVMIYGRRKVRIRE